MSRQERAVLVDRVVVPFEGRGAGAGPLAWGQQQVWEAMVDIGSSLPMGGVVAVTDGRTVEDFVRELRFHMCRYPSMRTLLRFGGDGTVTQEIFGEGETALEIHEGEDPGEDPAAVAEALAARWREREFDYDSEWPLRMGVVRHRGAVTHVVALMCHIAADLGGVEVMMRDLAAADPGPHTAPSPLDLALAQREPGMRRHTAAAMRYWEHHLRTVPLSVLGDAADTGDPTFCRLHWRSPALHLASARLAARAGADPAWVLLAALATGLHRVGRSPFVALGIIGNRFRPSLREVVSPLTQDGLCVLDVAGASAEQAIARARSASMSASKYAYYDPADRAALEERVGRDRGARVDLRVLYNDRRTSAAPPPGAEDPRAALARTELREEPAAFLGPKLMFHVEESPDAVSLIMEVDTRYLSLPDARRLLKEAERFAVEA
ncbi:condensation domain-containing protein [Dactylosporangium sp. CA-052675]|uniref:condensation domain-containing protein n=1 Tax=Dactylosporangium sp. CA-052675 TaxID=3239927 RepID=UPI003D94818C